MTESAHPDLLILTYSCPLDWDEMEGSVAIKHCRQCSLNVHNISRLAKMDAEQVFDRASRGELVCISSECPGDEKAPSRQIGKRIRVAVTALLSITASLLGWIKTPVSAAPEGSSPGKVPARNVFAIDDITNPIDHRKATSGTATDHKGPLSQLANVDRYSGMGFLPNPLWSSLDQQSKATSLDAHIWMLRRGIISPAVRSDPFQTQRERILARIDRDRVIATDEVIALSNLYRKKGFQDAADKTLALAVLLLDLKKAYYIRAGQEEQRRTGTTTIRTKEAPGFAYSETKNLDRYHYKTLLDLSDKCWMQKDYSSSAVYLRSALLVSLDNPLLTPVVKKTDINGRMEKLTPFLPANELHQVKEAADLAKGRLDDLSELKAPD